MTSFSSRQESLHGMQKKHRSITILEEILLDLHHHLARLAWLIQEYPFSVKQSPEPLLKIQQR